MKRIFLAVYVFAVVVLSTSVAPAELKETDLKKAVTLTEEAMLLSQVDAVALYMTSEKVAYAPRLTSDKIIEVETTVLSKDLISNSARLEAFVTRGMKAFVSVLKERLPIYAPSIAGTFDENKDIKFIVNAGGKRIPVATCVGGGWKWDVAWSSTQVAASSYAAPTSNYAAVQASPSPAAAEPEKKGKLACDCPARR